MRRREEKIICFIAHWIEDRCWRRHTIQHNICLISFLCANFALLCAEILVCVPLLSSSGAFAQFLSHSLSTSPHMLLPLGVIFFNGAGFAVASASICRKLTSKQTKRGKMNPLCVCVCVWGWVKFGIHAACCLVLVHRSNRMEEMSKVCGTRHQAHGIHRFEPNRKTDRIKTEKSNSSLMLCESIVFLLLSSIKWC